MRNSVFEDLGFSEEKAKDLAIRTELIDGIIGIVKKHDYSQKELQELLKQPQSEVSYLLNGKVSRFSSEKLLRFLNRLNAKVEIKIKAPRARIAI
ncbi:MAG: helix-turn-helix domain-containing protein [Oligoflexus sp.]